MRTFNSVYTSAKADSQKAKSEKIEREHAQIVSAVKRTYGINDFGALDESDRAYYKSIIDAMWNINEGITPKGVEFINEANAPVTSKSSDEQIEKKFRREVRLHMDSILSCIFTGSTPCVQLNKIIKDIEKDIDRKLSATTIKTWLKDEVTTAAAKKVSKLKF